MPPTTFLLLTPEAVAGPTTDIEAEPTWSPDELSTRNWSSAAIDLVAVHPLGAGLPDGRTAVWLSPLRELAALTVAGVPFSNAR
jgi:hypothetical protein